MKIHFPSLKLVLTSCAGAALLAACEKQEPTAAAPSPQTAPVPAAGSAPDPAPAAAEPGSAAEPLTGEAALAAFKAEVNAIRIFMEANQGTTDPVAGFESLRELIKRANAVSTAGLPEDLAVAYQNMNEVMNGVQGTLSDLPVPLDQIQKYMEEEKAKGGEAEQEAAAKMAAFQTAMAAHEKAGEEASAALKEAGAKYGIEFPDLTGK